MRHVWAAILLLATACGGDGDSSGGVTEPTRGAIEIRTGTSGEASSDYTVAVDNGTAQPIGPNASLTISDLEPGPHVVLLAGLPTGCTVSGPNPASVSVTAGSTTILTFTVTCTPPPPQTGTIVVTTVTTGTDADGYQISLDGGAAQPIGTNATITLPNVPAGAHSVLLAGLDPTCAVPVNPVNAVVAAGATVTVTFSVTCTAIPPQNQPPVAGFTVPSCTVNVDCAFIDTSSDPDGSIAAWSWTFGDPAGGTAMVQHPTYRFTTEGTFNVTLTVTDNRGATNSISQPVTVSPPAAAQCTQPAGSLTEVDCALGITQRSTITITLTGEDCELDGSLVHIPPPDADVAQNVFTNVCHSGAVGQQNTLTTETGAPLVFEAGAQLHVRLRRGTGTPPPGSPAGNITGTFPTWTLNFEDGGNPGGLGEPDFTDVVLTVQANSAP
jgi:PKD repeat protein